MIDQFSHKNYISFILGQKHLLYIYGLSITVSEKGNIALLYLLSIILEQSLGWHDTISILSYSKACCCREEEASYLKGTSQIGCPSFLIWLGLQVLDRLAQLLVGFEVIFGTFFKVGINFLFSIQWEKRRFYIKQVCNMVESIYKRFLIPYQVSILK